MNTVFVEITLQDGSRVTINPAALATIEAFPGDGSLCLVRMALNRLRRPEENYNVDVIPLIYITQGSPEEIQRRLDGAQRLALSEYVEAMKTITQAALDSNLEESPEN
jgi:hypothetical protein